jgi:hypothetical protein
VNFKDQDELDRALEFWQGRLRLRDWHIKARLMPTCDLPLAGQCHQFLTTKEAAIDIQHPPTNEAAISGYAPNQEQVLVHELLHIHFTPSCPDRKECQLKYDLWEQGIDEIAKCFVSAQDHIRAINAFSDQLIDSGGHIMTTLERPPASW